ncbi:hypothetical protein PRK78_006391 [Emydomyces testavorans]|uniref:Uncharacterized protein n=1 Tax=Emydomyces testavorans TaxID=2070801 RepID=A0AAF0DM05_9EURO|nr:hypothetical protein PRK78_006391 [Emydomyces testavorans]
MNSHPGPTIRSSDLVTDFLEDILHGHFSSITLIVCGTREKFTQQLLTSIQLQSQYLETGDTEGEDPVSVADTSSLCHTVFSNTIDILDKSQRVILSFCPSLEHLRAYLGAPSIWPSSRFNSGRNASHEGQPLLGIINLIALHFHTSEYSAQGISRTLALAVEVAAKKDMDLVLCECQDLNAPDQDIACSGSLLNAVVPLLNSTVKGRHSEGIPATKTIQIKEIAKKWFYFDLTETEGSGLPL